MALIDKASLLFVPSVVAEGKAFNILPSGNRAPDSTDQNSGYDQTRADFDFDRGSNAAATRIGSDGLIKKYRENLLLRSNAFDTTWTTYSASVTSGQSGYDGSNNAWLLTATNTFNRVQQSISVSGVKRFSVYAKANTNDYLLLGSFEGAHFYATFNLATGAVDSNNANVISPSIEDVGGGWYRCSATWISTTTQVRIGTQDASSQGAWASTTAGSIFIQSAQLETGLVATDVLTSGATTAKAGVLIDLPRINYDANGENGSLLLEPSRTNLVGYSEYQSSAIYTNDKVSIADNVAISPEGLQNAAKIILDSGTNASNGGHSDLFSSTAGTNYTISVFAKAGEMRYFTLTYGSASASGGHFDLQEGTLLGAITNAQYSNESAFIEDYGNGWYRLIVSLTDNISSTGRRLSMKPSPSASVPPNNSYQSTGDGVSGAYIYGFQLEANATYATSYIPNHGSTGGVTRAADSCSVTGASDVIGQTEGTMFVEAETLENGADCRITLSDNTISNRVSIEWDATADTIKGFVGTAGNLFTSSYNQTNRNKIAIVYNSSDARFFVNGVKVDTDTTVSSLSGMNRIDFSNYGAALPFVGKVYKMYVSEEKLTDAEAITLTTL